MVKNRVMDKFEDRGISTLILDVEVCVGLVAWLSIDIAFGLRIMFSLSQS